MSLKKFLRQALSKSPDERFPKGGEFAAALRRAGAGASGQPVATDALAELDRAIPDRKLPPRRSSREEKKNLRPYLLLLLLLGAAAAAGWVYRDRLPLDRLAQSFLHRGSGITWLETTVHTEPPGLPVSVEGSPIEASAAGVVRFPANGDPVVVSTTQGCRVVEQTLVPADAGGEVVLLVENERYTGRFDPGIAGARVSVNGKSAGTAPVDLDLDLCEANVLEFFATEYRPASLNLAAQARPVDVRTALAGWTFERIPIGKLVLGATSVTLVYYLDGKRLGKGTRKIDLPEGRHKIRFKNDKYWIDETRSVEIVGGETLNSALKPPALTNLVVQAFPANCKVFLRRPGGSWKYIDDTPVRKRIAVGTYEVRVTFNPTGENKDRTIKLKPGGNPPIRVSFGGG